MLLYLRLRDFDRNWHLPCRGARKDPQLGISTDATGIGKRDVSYRPYRSESALGERGQALRPQQPLQEREKWVSDRLSGPYCYEWQLRCCHFRLPTVVERKKSRNPLNWNGDQ